MNLLPELNPLMAHGHDPIVLLQLVTCAMMTGLIWLVQVLVYPSFQLIEVSRSRVYHAHHSGRITWVVFPIMTVELLTAGYLVYADPNFFWILNLAGVALIWGATGLISVPLHTRLGENFETQTIRRLIRTNWIRTFLWSLRLLALVGIAAGAGGLRHGSF